MFDIASTIHIRPTKVLPTRRSIVDQLHMNKVKQASFSRDYTLIHKKETTSTNQDLFARFF